MSTQEKCNLCGSWDDSIYVSRIVINLTNWMSGDKKYILCHNCAKKLDKMFTTDTFEIEDIQVLIIRCLIWGYTLGYPI